MRFLLNAPRHVSKRLSNGTTKVKQNTPPQKETGGLKAWGQQCSPNCGCTIRFEATMDPNNNNQIISANYDAKTIVTQVQKVSHGSGQHSTILKPVRTQPRHDSHESRPLVEACKCKTLHGLANTITEVLPKYRLSQAQNQLEYVGTRSSTAFRYSALKNLDLLQSEKKSQGGSFLTNDNDDARRTERGVNINDIPEGHCYDLVEEALIACLQGYIPKPRPIAALQRRILSSKQQQQQQQPQQQKDQVQRIRTKEIDKPNENSNGSSLDPLRFVTAAKRRAKERLFKSLHQPSNHTHTRTSSSSMPPFHLMADSSHHDGHTHTDTLTQIKMEIENQKMKELDAALEDWVAYVDEKQNARLD